MYISLSISLSLYIYIYIYIFVRRGGEVRPVFGQAHLACVYIYIYIDRCISINITII